jgi:hypothetical protein
MAAAEGTFFPFEREEAVDGWPAAAVGGTDASDAAGVGLLGLAFAFFEGGSIKPSSLQAYGSLS